MSPDAPIVMESSQQPPSAAVIWLHGLGADGRDFVDVVNILALTERGVRFILPNAPVQPVTINAGMKMRAWFDIASPDLTSGEDRQGFENSFRLMRHWLDEQVNDGIAADRVIFAGFSQGAAVSLYSAMRMDKKIAGVIALSGYLPFAAEMDNESHGANRGIALFMGHGVHDPVVPFDIAELSIPMLKTYFDVQWRSYPMQHTVSLEEIEDIKSWLETTLALPF